jgi:rare lipoprotein A
MTAAHRTLPLGTLVRVINVATGQSANVRITDRGPFVPGRIIDLSLAAAKATGLYRMGVGKVKVEVYQLPPNVDIEGRWCVQVGAFARESDSVKLKETLLRRYATAKVIEFAGPTGHWVRITAAKPDRAHAAEVAAGIHPVDPAAVPYLVRTN